MMIVNEYSIEDILKITSGQDVKVFLYGAGTGVSSYSKISLASLKYFGIVPSYFLDDDRKRDGAELFGIKIKHPEVLLELNCEKLIIISSNYFESISKTLSSISGDIAVYSSTGLIKATPAHAFDQVMDYNEVLRRLHTHNTKLNRINNMLSQHGGLVLNALDIQVTEKCTMKCKDCSNLMQYYKKPENADTNILNESVISILSSVDRIDDVRVLGGEPFLYKDLPVLFNLLTASDKVPRITVYTNATFVPKNDVLISLQNPKIQVEITDYDDLSKRHVEMVATLRDNEIRYISHKPQNWTDSARIVKNDKSAEELTEMFERCCVNDVLTLLHGKIYHCPFSGNAHNLNAIESDPSDWLDLSSYGDKDKLRTDLLKFYFGKPYQTSCKYCLGRDFSQDQVIPAVQTRMPLDLPDYGK